MVRRRTTTGMVDFTKFKFLTFDCYGTLIDWETGILSALRPVMAAHKLNVADDELLARYAQHETDIERGTYRLYRDVLAEVIVRLGEDYGFSPSEAEKGAIAESIAHWQPFPDTVEALRRLGKRYRLVIVSNIDDDLFEFTRSKLGVEFYDVITAQQARSYKPSYNNFHLALRRIKAQESEVLHVAQSLYHDVAPARSLGLTTAWINRRSGKEGAGATPASEAQPDVLFKSMADLASAVEPWHPAR